MFSLSLFCIAFSIAFFGEIEKNIFERTKKADCLSSNLLFKNHKKHAIYKLTSIFSISSPAAFVAYCICLYQFPIRIAYIVPTIVYFDL